MAACGELQLGAARPAALACHASTSTTRGSGASSQRGALRRGRQAPCVPGAGRPVQRRRGVSRAAQAGVRGGDGAREQRRVVITGQGLVSSLGSDVDEFYGSLLGGRSGIRGIEGFDASALPTRIAGEVCGFEPAGYVPAKWVKRMDAVMQYMAVAGKRALESGALPHEGSALLDVVDARRGGILIGTAMGGMSTFASGVEALFSGGVRRMNPFCIPFAIANMGGAMLAVDLGLMGPNYAISTACATANYCILSAAAHIRAGDADVMLAGGADAAVVPSSIAGFNACRALSTRNYDPAGASRPYDRDRDGFVMGEGAGVLLLESLDHARARGAPILAELLGGAVTSDAHNMTEPDPAGRGIEACIRTALARAGVEPDRVSYVNAHGTSTPAGDVTEYRAIRRVIPHQRLKINSTKSMIGHLLGAAAGVEAVVAIQALRTGLLHPNINLDNPDEAIDMSVMVGGTQEEANLDVVLSNSFGFGGHNSCILLSKFQE